MRMGVLSDTHMQGLLNSSEIIPNTGNLDNFLGLVKLATFEKNLLVPIC